MAGHPGRVLQVFRVFLLLGLGSFGGPVAHLGYYRQALVAERHWLSDAEYAQIVALCQFLPGPSSSQIGQAIGLLRAGLPGMFAAWLGFTLPSAVLMFAAALTVSSLDTATIAGAGWLHGLKLAAVAVVAQAVFRMARTLAPDAAHLAITVAALATAVIWASPAGQLAALLLGGALAFALPLGTRETAAANALRTPVKRRTALVALALLIAGLVLLPLLAVLRPDDGLAAMADGVYRAGTLVFGGGHVVLPLLEREVAAPAGLDHSTFLAGYGLAQALPGPLFSFAAYLGATLHPGAPVVGAVIALVAIFLPGSLLLLATLPWWSRLSGMASVARAVAGINAAVVGLLGAILWDPVIRVAVTGVTDAAIAAVALAALMATRAPVYLIVPACALAGWLLL